MITEQLKRNWSLRTPLWSFTDNLISPILSRSTASKSSVPASVLVALIHAYLKPCQEEKIQEEAAGVEYPKNHNQKLNLKTIKANGRKEIGNPDLEGCL